jgi:hypothetical protein
VTSAIWKARLPMPGALTLEHSGILHVGIDPNGVPCIWFWRPDSEDETTLSRITLFGTGIEMTPKEASGRYIGTFVWRTFVLHAFEQVVE